MVKHRALLLVGSLYTSPRQSLEEPLLIRTNQRVSLTLTEKDSLTALEQLLIQEAPSRQLLYRLLSWGLSLISVSIILVAIVALSVYEDLAKQLLLHHRFAGNYADWLSVGMMVLVIAGIGLAPAIVSGESSQLKEVLKSWFFHDLRRTHRLGKVIRGWKKTLPLHLYNVDRLSEQHWFWRLLAPVFLRHFQCSVWHVRHDQVNALEQWLQHHGVEAIERKQHPSAQVNSFFF